VADRGEQFHRRHDPLQHDQHGKRDEQQDDGWSQQTAGEDFHCGKDGSGDEQQHHGREAAAKRLAWMIPGARDHAEDEAEQDVHAPEGQGQPQERNNRLAAIEPHGPHAEPLVSQVTEELAEQHAEDDGEERTRARDLRDGSRGAAWCGPVVYDERHDCQHESVPDVAEHQPEEHREEDAHVRRWIDGAVAGKR
jgi:hypothetical protein